MDCCDPPRGELFTAAVGMPYNPAKAAAALWDVSNLKPELYRNEITTKRSSFLSEGAWGPLGEARANNYGGMNTGGPQVGPYWDPRAVTTASTHAVPGCLPLPRQGTAEYVEHVPAPKTQYAPHGAIAYEPLVVDLSACGGRCVCAVPVRFSLAAEMLVPRSVALVRTLLEQTGLVVFKGEDDGHPCRILGPDLYAGFAAYTEQFNSTAAIRLLNVWDTVVAMDTAYVENVVQSQTRHQVITNAQANYLRAEGNRAFLEPRPEYGAAIVTPPPPLPPVMPGMGNTVVEGDGYGATRAFTDPRAGAAIRAEFARVTRPGAPC
jgi:hypothetical protein